MSWQEKPGGYVNSANSLAGESAPTAATPFGLLQRRAFLLGGANALDYAIQFLLPVVLVRSLSAESFGQYRLIWLAVMTIMAIVPLAMPHSLYYFLPRSGASTKRLYVHQTMLYMIFVGLLGGLLISPWNPIQPTSLQWFSEYGLLLPGLMLFWAAAALLDQLPTIDERVVWQAKITISLSVLRAITLGAAAYLTGDLRVLVWVMVAFALVKFLLLLGYIAVTVGFSGPWAGRRSFIEQLRYALPFGVSDTLYGLRGQADQWVAAALFSLHSFAAFSIAGVLGPLVNLFRVSVNHVFLPSMSRLQATNDVRGMLELNSRANIMVAALVYPMLAFAFVYAEQLLSLVYTATYLEAAPVMRVYVVSLTALVVELASLTLLLKEGAFVLRLNLIVIMLSIAMSWLGAQQFGLAGAALGSVMAIFLDRFATLRRLQARTAIPWGQLQDWSSLGLLMLFSIIAALLAWVVTGQYFVSAGLFQQLLVGGAVMAVSYAVMTALHGIGRGWINAAYNFKS